MQSEYREPRLLIGGEWLAAGARDTLPVVNPATEETLGAVPVATPADLDQAIECAGVGFKVWRQTSALERARVLRRAAGLLRERLESNSTALTLEQGKPLGEARTECSAAADFFDWYADEGRWAPTAIADTPLSSRAMREEPFGPIALMRSFDTQEEAVAAANSLPYGLAAYVFTLDRARAVSIRHELESGLVGINTFSITWPETPFGGVKESGHGREGGSEGLDAYLVTKLISES